jgi:8-oxo-dGTP pyrophosphatase MutT (NUDIX family)
MKNPWKKLSSRIAYTNPWMTIREDKVIRPDGKKGIYGLMLAPGPSVFVIALTKDKKIYLVKQFRYTFQKPSWELPAGNAGKDKPLAAAKRELWEETGLTANHWKLFGKTEALNVFSYWPASNW